MRPSVFVRTQYWYAEGVPAASNFHTGLLQTVWKCEAEKQPGWNCTWTPLSPSLVASLVKLKRKSFGRPHYLTVLLHKIPRKHFVIWTWFFGEEIFWRVVNDCEINIGVVRQKFLIILKYF